MAVDMHKLPCGWKRPCLDELVPDDKPIVYGIVQAGPEHPSGVPYIRSSDVGAKIEPTQLARTSPKIAEKYRRSIVTPGDIVFSLRGNIGQLSIVPEELPVANLTQGTARVSANSKANSQFIAFALRSPMLQRRIATVGKGSTFKEISLEELRKLEIPLPPLPEQRKIAEILRTWDEAIEKLEALRAAKLRRLAAVAQRLLAPTRSIGPDVIRSNWPRCTFGEVFRERQDRNDGLNADDVVTVGKYAIRRQSEHFTRSVASADLSSYWTISPGDFVYDPMSAYYGAIGRYIAKSAGIVSPAYRVIRLSSAVDSDFMVHLLKTHHIRFLLETRSSQGNKEGKRRLLQRDEFDSIDFFLPPIEEQRRIVEALSHFERHKYLTDQELLLLTRQKRGLMQKLLTGEWRVNAKRT